MELGGGDGEVGYVEGLEVGICMAIDLRSIAHSLDHENRELKNEKETE